MRLLLRKSVSKDLPSGGVWRTINGVHLYIKGGKVIVGPSELKGKPVKLVVGVKPKQSSGGKSYDIGITSFRGKAAKKVSDVKSYFDTARAKGMYNGMHKTAYDAGMQINIEKVAGVWEKSIEPSFKVQLQAKNKEDVISFASLHGLNMNQDAVIVFREDSKASGTRYTFRGLKNVDKALDRMDKAGIPGATVSGDSLILYDFDGSMRGDVEKLQKSLSVKPHVAQGEVSLIEREDYRKGIKPEHEKYINAMKKSVGDTYDVVFMPKYKKKN